jgi:hypothetical protein
MAMMEPTISKTKKGQPAWKRKHRQKLVAVVVVVLTVVPDLDKADLDVAPVPEVLADNVVVHRVVQAVLAVARVVDAVNVQM